ncbi:YDG domain-containing protein, partial [Polynucleobacter sp. AP-Melu-500A-A1]|uniref:YDG domain-containing protein n=1 Tax=Polynucleobacter sp. AP-Melu-500A-A1 TaxID=2576929 RepID=UPI001C0DCC1B
MQNPIAKRVAIFLLLALAVLLHVNFSHAQTVNVNMNPGGGKVVAGTAVITQSGLQTNVNQSSQRAVVNWDSFNVGKDATVNFNQPNSSAVTLNRVTGSSPSVIDGAIKANGQVVLVNPNGITFGRGAQVDAAGVVASTMNISDKDFMDGKSTYKGDGTGKILNEGKITTNSKDGYIALLAPEVRNDGYLVAKMGAGTVALAAGKQITLDFRGDNLISVKVDESTVNALIENKRLVKVEGGLVIIAAGAASNLMNSVIKNTGRISASSAVNNGGVIEFIASNITQAGQISANGKGSNSDGGKITLQGEDITLADGSNTNARGTANGGLINVGTTKVTFTQNQDGTRSNVQAENLAKTTTVQAGATVDASSTSKGNGGDINIWSAVKTIVAGTFKAQGGINGGNGGFVETSSSGVLEILKSTVVDVTAKLGKAGSWLLDPESMTISASTASAISTALATSNVTIEVKGDLTVAAGAAIAPSNGAATTLTLNATGTITNNGTISTSNTGSLVTNSAALSLSAGSTTSANQITATAQAVTVNGSLSSTGGSSGSINVTGGAIIVAGRVSSNGSSTTGSATTSNTATTRTREEELAAQAPSAPTANANTTTTQIAAKAQAAAASTAVAATVASNNVSANAAKVSIPAVVNNLANNANAGSAVITPAVNVVNLTAPTAAVLNTNIANAAQAAGQGTTTIINVASASSGTTPSAPSAPLASLTFTAQTPSQVTQAASAATASPNTAGGTITMTASNSVTATSTASITANAAPATADQPAISSAGGTINIAAPQVITQSGSVMQANGNNGPGGNFNLQATQLSIAGSVQANGNTGGTITAVTNSSNLQSGSLIQANGNNGPGGAITLQTINNQVINNAQLQANGSGNGGNIQLITTSGDINLQSAIIQTNGANGRGGQIGIAATNYTALESSTVEATGYIQGGHILIGNDAKNAGNNSALPFSIFTNLDANSIINVNQTDLLNTTGGGFIETSGQTINLLSSINAGRGGMWLLDPTNVTISTTSGTSSGSNPLLFTNQTNVSATQIQTAINAGTSVQIIADGTITQTANLTFAPAASVNVGLTFDNRTGTAQSITLTGTTTNTGAGNLTLNYLSSGQIAINGAINSTSTGKVNVLAQSFYAANAIATCSAGVCANIYNGASGSITTKGGYVVLDATGGSISGTIITPGTIANAPIYLAAAINTTTSGLTTSSAGGNLSVAGADSIANVVGSFEYSVGLNIGGNANIQLKNTATASYGFVVNNYATTAPLTVYGNIDISSNGVNANSVGLIYLTSALTSTTGNINLTASSTNTTIATNPGVSSLSTGTITANSGAITINSNTYVSSPVVLAGAISAKSIAITGTATTASTIVSLGAITIATGGTDLSVIANNTAAGANTGITQTGAITNNASGGNISFISNNIINQTGAITLAANTSGTASAITYDTTSGNKAANITGGVLTIAAGSTSDVNYIAKSAGSGINPGSIGSSTASLPGYVLLDNTYGAASGAPVSGYITNANSGTLTGAIIGVNVNSAITATKNITLIGASQTGYYSVAMTAAITTSMGSIAVTGSGINYSVYSSAAGTLTASTGSLTINGTSTTGQAVQLAGAITTQTGITINGTGTTATTIVTAGAMTLGIGYAAGTSSSPTVISNAAGTSGSLIGLVSGATMPTVSSAAISILVAGTSVAYGNPVTAVALLSSTSNTATYIIGYADATYSKMVQVVLTSSSGSVYATESSAKYNTTLLSTGGASNLLGGSTNILSLWNGSAAGGLGTATAMTLATSSTTGGYGAANLVLSGVGYVRNNPSGNITVTANNTAAGSNTGITQSGAITNNVSGSNITFISNNNISQNGAISLVANTSGTAANITYDTTTGNKSSTILSGALTIASGSTSAINYIMKSDGGAINPGVIGSTSVALPGYVLIDNTYGCTGTGCASTSGFINTTANNLGTLATGSIGVTINGVIYATGAITINGVASANQGIGISAIITSTGGAVTLNGGTTNSYGVYNPSSLIAGNSITITGTSTAIAAWDVQLSTLTINSAATGGSITVTGNIINTPGANGGIYQAGAITGTNGSNITFISNNNISQNGAISLVANTSGTAANITYDTTTGNKSSTILSGALTIASGSTSAINYIMKSDGGAINPGVIGSTSVALPGYVLIDNTYGCTGTGCASTSGFINTTANNLGTLATGSIGVTINGVIYATGAITINGVASANQGIGISAIITSTGGAVTLNGGTTNSYGVYNPSSLIAGNSITITGTSTAIAAWDVQLSTLTINSAATGGSITVTGNIINTPGANGGIYQAGAITGTNGSNITFISNNNISQNGAISLVANTSGTAANITYDTTAGNKTSTINTAALTISAGSTSGINYSVLAAGSAITIGGAVAVPGSITLDNTFGCSGSGCAPVSGYLNKNLASWATLATTSNGIVINNTLSGTAITINGINASGTTGGGGGVMVMAGLTATTGNINITGTSTTGNAVANLNGSWGLSPIVANNGAVNITGTSTATGNGVELGPNNSISAKSITIIGSEVGGTYAVYLNTMTIVAGGTNLNVTGTVNLNTDNGIYQAGAINDNATGSNISFISNGIINQTGAITLVANAASTAVSVTYNTTSGNKSANITTGALTVAAGANTSAINYIAKSSGSAINPGAIGSSTVALPGYVLIDNTYGCTGTNCTPVTGFINPTINNIASLATGSVGITLNNAIYATNTIAMNGSANANQGIGISAAITSTGGAVSLTGSTTNSYGVYNPSSLITANSITVTGTSSAAATWDVQLSALTINSTAIGGSITVIGNVINTPGANGGIYQSGAITGANGSSISFISNNNISQNGAINLPANASGTPANITYDVTTGNKTSTISATGILSIASGSTSAINYIEIASGAALTTSAIGSSTIPLPGYVLFDNTYGCAGTGCTPVSGYLNSSLANWATLVTTSNGIVVSTAIYATNSITINGINASGTTGGGGGVMVMAGLTATTGNINITGTSTTGIGVANLNGSWGLSPIVANNGAVNITGTSTATGNGVELGPNNSISAKSITIIGSEVGGTYAVYLNTMTIVAGGTNLNVTGTVNLNTDTGIYQAGAINDNAVGGNIRFISNGIINQTGAISLVANTGGTAANIIYDTTSGTKASNITTGALTIAAGTNTSGINYIVKSAGSAINPGTIGSSTLTLPGYVLIDNTFGCTGTGCTPATGFINTTTNNLASLATTSVGLTINNAIYAAGAITANGVASANQGIGYTAAMTSTGSNVILTGGTTTSYGVYGTALITANNITITGTSSGAPSYDAYLNALTINAGATGGSITIAGNVIATPGTAGGIYQSGAITGVSGTNISFISNNNISQNGAISLAANTSGTASNITYDTTTGNKTSTLSSAALTIATGSTSAINYIIKTNGGTISPPAISVPGYILLDNTCLGCATATTPANAAVNGNAITLGGALSAGTLAGTTGIMINAVANGTGVGFVQGANAIASSAGGVTITANGQTGTGYTSSGAITATGQAVTINATITTGSAINDTGAITGGIVTITGSQTTATATATVVTVTGLITANNVTITGNGGAASTIVSLGAVTINAGGSNLTVTANNVAGGGNTGITQTGAITDNAVGSNITFTSNNIINQTGAISLVANTGGTAANIIYDTTSGTKASNITTGALTIAAGTNTSGINYIVKSAGSAINPGTIGSSTLTLPGYVLIDNTFGCTGTGCTPATGFINTTTNNLASLATTSVGLTINNAIYAAGAITANGVASANQGIGYTAAMTSTGSNVILTGGTTTSYGVYGTALITANNITITGTSSGAPSYDAYLNALTINAGATGGSITIAGNVIATPGTAGGIYQSGAITGVSGTNISFISNNNISQNGAISLAANTSGTASNITYDTTTGNKTSTISSAALTIATGSTSAINYIIKTNGGTISPPAISVPGYILLDNTCLGCATATTPANAAVNGNAITLGGALSAGTLAGTTGIMINAVANGTGVGFVQGANAIASSAGGVTITANGQTGTGYTSSGAITATGQAVTINATITTGSAINDTGAITGGIVTITGSQTTATATATVVTVTGLITANNVTITGNGGAASTIVSLGAVTINAGGSNLTVTANNVAGGGNTGITQTGAITDNAVGSNITFTSNNIINQTGAISLVANTGTPIANVIYDTTRGARTSNITSGVLTFTTGVGSVINYIAKSAGSSIDPGAIGTSTIFLPGYVLIDNTFGCSGTGCTPATGFINTTTNNLSTLATASNVGIGINDAIYATGNIVISGVSSNSSGVNYSAAIKTTGGGITITGSSTANYGIYASSAAGIATATSTMNGAITFNGYSSATSSHAIYTSASATITGATGVYLTGLGSSGNITTGALIQNSGATGGVIVDAVGNVSLTGVTNSGVNGIRITAGDGIAAGTITGGNVTAVGTITNTGGVVGISMAAPENAACTTGCTIANAIGITTANADATKNISYGILGGALVNASAYTGGNFINYRQRLTNTLAISVTLNSNYSAEYGTGYNSASANTWLQANSTVSYTGSITASFGVTTTTMAYVKSVLMFSPTVGGTTSSNGTNANAVQTNTALTAASVSATDGSAVTLVPAGRTYSIAPAVLGISVSGVYNGTTSYSNQNATIVTTGLAAWDTITNVTVSSANAYTANAYVTAVAGTATGVNTFSSLNYLINGAFNSALTNGLPVKTSQSSATNRVTITPAPLGVTINAVYSGTTSVTPTSFTITGLVNSQTITGISAATINAINVSANTSNYVTAITLGGGTASIGNYFINPVYNTVSSNTQNTVTLTPKALTVTGITIAAKTYDGTKSATVSGGSLVGVSAVDLANVTLAQSATFVSPNVANNVALVMVGSISGSASGNYTLTQPTGITANISQKVLTVGGTTVAANKVYDGTTAATITGGTLVGVVTADLANVNLIQSGSFAQSNVANAISVTINDSLSGPASANYILTQPANVTANITPKALTVAGTTVANKVYDGSTAATVTGGTLVGVLGVDAANVTLIKAGSFTTANAGIGIAVTISDSISGSASANYSLTQPTGVIANITPAPLGITLAGVYSGSTTVTPTSFTLTGLVNGETISAISSANVANINVAANSSNFVRSIVVGSGTALASNYAFNTITCTAAGTSLNTVTLSTKTLTVTGTLADAKVYDGTTSVNVWGGSLVGVVGGDVVSLKQAGSFNSANVGSAVVVVINDSISGASSSNYTLIQPTGVTAAITVKTLTVSDGTVAHKTYDGTTNATLTGGSLIGLVAGDAGKVTLVQAGSFSSPNVSNGIIIIVNDSITGVASTNYRLVQPTGITANITPAMLGISVVGVANGTNNITPISYTINGLINGQTITGLSSVTVNSSSISSNGSNFVTGIVISGGTALATNYAFAPAYSATSGIGQNIATLVAANQKILTVTGTVAVSKVYDGTTAITITGGTLVGVSSGDTVNLVQSATLLSPNVSSSASVIVSDSITGASAANYILVQPSGITAIITPAPLGITVSGEYNGTTTLAPASYTITGLVAGQTITGISSVSVSNANVSGNGSNYVTSMVSSGGTASLSNYSINTGYNASSGNTKNVATITAKALTVGSSSVAANKVYDGTSTATITGGSLIGVIGSDVVNLTQAGNFSQSAVGNSIAVTAADTISGAAAGNYSLIQPTGLTANITPKVLTVSGVSVANKVYDGTTIASSTLGSLVGLISADSANITLTQSATFSSGNVGNSIPVTVYDTISGVAAGNYTVVQLSGLSANITPKNLTVTGTAIANKVYDGTNTATVTSGSLVGVVAADSANVTLTATATFSSTNSGNGIAININDVLGGSAAGNYTLTQPTGFTANITPKALTVTGTTVANKVYDATNTATVSGGTLVGVVAGDTVALTQAGTFSQSNVGTGLAVTIADSLTNNSLGNYTLTQPTGFTANITPATITVSIATQTKVYDSTNTASLAAGTSSNAGSYTLSGFVAGQGAYINQTNATYNSANVADAATVSTTLSTGNYVALGTTNLSNYALPLSISGTGSITAAPLTMTADAAAKFVGQADPSFTYTLTGLKGADTSSVLVGAAVTRPAGEIAGASYTLTPSATAANYNITPVTASLNIIAQGQLLITVGNASTSYGTLTSANVAASAAVSASYCSIGSNCALPTSIVALNVVAGLSANTWIASDSNVGAAQGKYTLTITPPTLTAANSSTGGYLNVGNYAFTPSSTVTTNAGFATNYATGYPVLTVAGTITITPLTLTINAPSPSKVYDATNAIVGNALTASNAKAGDQVIISGTGTYANSNAGTGLSYTISSIAISGTAGANYAFAGNVTGTNGVITKAPLTISGASIANKAYDGTNVASFSAGTLNGVVSSDSANLTLTQVATFSQINVGNNLVVTIANTIGGSAAGNYTLTQPTGLTANITPKALTVTGTTVANKVYDATNT